MFNFSKYKTSSAIVWLIPISIILLGMMCFFAYKYFDSTKDNRELIEYYEHRKDNIFVFSDSIRVYKDEKQRLTSEIDLLEFDKKTLQTKFSDLQREYNILKKEKKQPLIITKVEYVNKNDSIKDIPLQSVSDTTFNFEYTKEWSKTNRIDLKGNILLNRFDLNKSTMNIDYLKQSSELVYSIIEDKDGYLSVNVKSNNPNFEVTKMQGSLFDIRQSIFFQNEKMKDKVDYIKYRSKPFSFGIGLQTGYGISYSQDFINPNIKHIGYGPYIGVGVSISFKIVDF